MIVKICGITNSEDARKALALGTDWIGLNFVGGVRQIAWAQALPIIQVIDAPSSGVALVNCTPNLIQESLLQRLQDVGIRRLQLYGHILPDTLRELHQKHFECIVPFSMGTEDDLAKVRDFMSSHLDSLPDYILVDAAVAGQMGGTGRQANWPLLKKAATQGQSSDWPPLLLAGGLTPYNVSQAITQVTPVGVDVSSGVERNPGEKDFDLMRDFVRHARTGS